MAIFRNPLHRSPARNKSGPHYLGLIPEGADGTRHTLDIMGALARDAARDPEFIEFVTSQVIAGVPSKDYAGEARAIHDWIAGNVRYTLDPIDVETVRSPQYMLSHPFGDCDDMSTLAAAMYMAAGHKARFVAIGFQPDVFEHVYAETLIGTRWIPSDTTEPNGFGWCAPDPLTRLNRRI